MPVAEESRRIRFRGWSLRGLPARCTRLELSCTVEAARSAFLRSFNSHEQRAPGLSALGIGSLMRSPVVAAFAGCLFLPVSGCSGDECPSRESTVVHASFIDTSGSPVCDVLVSVAGPGADEELQLSDAMCSYTGGDRAGIYTIKVFRGKGLLQIRQVEIATDECGAVPQSVVVRVPGA